MRDLVARLTRGSWKTSTLGAALIAIGVVQPALEGKPATRETAVVAIVGLALILAKDYNRSGGAR